MIDFQSNIYKTVSNMIKTKREQGANWDAIYNVEFLGDLNEKQKTEILLNMFGVDLNYWQEIVNNEKDEEKYGQLTSLVIPIANIPSGNKFDYKLDECEGSAWMSYKKLLLSKNGFDIDAVHNIQYSAQRILNKLSLDTRESKAIKGMVIGNVQSGKTANMAALMAMAADQGWNLFIILSGTIENLRIQTQERLISDLNNATNKSWTPIDNVSTNASDVYALSKLNLREDSMQRYLMVCLKNSTRLKNLIKWLKKDLNNRKNLKILLIDDEADQAGINAISIKKAQGKTPEEIERTKINEAIVNILNNRDENKKKISEVYKAIDYVAFTATPYANVLNERPGDNSTYPANFVSALPVSHNYFGPQQIFGIDGTDYDGLNIINNISIDEVEYVKEMYQNKKNTLPTELKKAILWFYCCFAIRKYKDVHKPVSMLIHTSQKTIDHETIAKYITKWINSLNVLTFIDLCKKVYIEQTNKFTIEDFHSQYKDYGIKDIDDYPDFSSISNILVEIFNEKINSIKIDENNELKFSKGVHLCIDNCHHNFIENNDEHIRLIYPKEKDNINYTTGFIVIGGATLSRGLTIEGLVSTYFLRTVKQADTLMQMGRWFGYRIGYELLQRIWLTSNTIKQFEALSVLDYDLRCEMKKMEEDDIKPDLVGIKIMQYPGNFLEITSKNKLKDAILVNRDFGGIATQTTIFYDDEDIIKENYINTEEFVKSLPKPCSNDNHVKAENCIIWNNIDSDKVLSYITKMNYPHHDASFFDTKLFKKWFNEIEIKNELNNWNVVLAGNEKDSNDIETFIAGYPLYKVNRSRKLNKYDDHRIRIGALRAAKDLYVDIDLSSCKLSKEDIDDIKISNTGKYRSIRKHAGLDKTPLLVIYIIDKNSKPRENSSTRINMNTKTDVIGLFMVIPENRDKNDNKNYVSVKIEGNESNYEEVDI